MSKDRGFKKLVGVTIQAVSAKAINEVLLVDEDDQSYTIGAEMGPLGIPVIALKKLKPNKYEIPSKKLQPLVRAGKLSEPFPYPPEKDKTLD